MEKEGWKEERENINQEIQRKRRQKGKKYAGEKRRIVFEWNKHK